ncbi:MAG: MBL fold metallo-hydrolase [Atopobiaceae bacterium]|nr:MBL fold metallo-hydrolase [Atopobiaceae bacterium]
MTAGFEVSGICEGLYRIVDVLGNHCYLVVGERQALLVDTCGGLGNLRSCVEELTDLPVMVALTHGHEDHMMGSFWFDEVRISELDGGIQRWELAEEHTGRIHEQAVGEGIVSDDAPFSLRDGARPCELPVFDGDVFDLGGRTVRAVSLPGHTAGSMGYLVDDLRVLLSGDAVTPIMCLFFDDSLTIQEWRDKTLARMAEIPFDRFYTGHHDHGFSRSDLASFDAAAAFALTDRGMEWEHNRLHEFRGIIHLCPSDTFDADSVDFRAVIDHWHELPPRKRRKRSA